MATIGGGNNDRVYSIKSWLGLNQNPDGDTKLKYGEAAVMENWRITRDGNLRRRPGTALQATVGTGPVRRLWSGMVAESECVLAACDDKLYRLFNNAEWGVEELGAIASTGDVFVFGFSEKAYILDGQSYRVYDGETLSDVVGYVPLVQVSAVPSGGGVALEQVNKLTASRRVQFSPDGTAVTLMLPEKNIASVDYVKSTVTGDMLQGYTVNLASGVVTLESAPESGQNTIEIQYTASEDYAYQVKHMRYAELFNGSQDSRVFIYGDGSNQAFYSGLDTAGQPRADYFPDMNHIAFGESNTPITAMVRHGSRLLAYKTNSVYSVYYSTVSLADGSMTAGFYVSPVHRALGNVAAGQVQVVGNYPRALHGEDCFEWRNASTYFTADERQAKRISDRVQRSLRQFNLEQCKCWDDNGAQEYYICYDKKALVHNYAADAWYYYTNFDAVSLMNFRDELYIGTSDGRVLHVSDNYRTDCGEAISAYWESGAMDFKADYMRKYTSALWVSTKPESNSYVEITVKTDRKDDFSVKEIARGAGSGFNLWDFNTFTFSENTQPKVKKLRIKAKKYAYFKLIFQTAKPNTVATVLAADIRSRQTGYAK